MAHQEWSVKRADTEVPFRDSLLGERVWRLGLEVGEHWKRNRTKHTRNSRAPKGEGLLLKNPGRNLVKMDGLCRQDGGRG